MPETDKLLFRRFRESLWLGVRLPAALKFEVDSAGQTTISQPLAYGELPERGRAWLEQASIFIPGVFDVMPDAPGQVDATEKVSMRLVSVDEFAKDPRRRYAAALNLAATPPAETLPWMALQAYQRIGQLPEGADNAAALEHIRQGFTTPRGVQPAILAGLVFIVESNAAPVPGEDVAVGNFGGDVVKLEVETTQFPGGVAFILKSGNPSIALKNGQIAGSSNQAGLYRIRRALGVAARSSRDLGPTWVPVPDSGTAEWVERVFRPVDRMLPAELVGELLNYTVELLNVHGEATHRGQVMIKRLRLDPPAAPSRGTATLNLSAERKPTGVTVRFIMPQREGSGPDGLTPALYRLDGSVIDTGFYGDADDAALLVGRLLSDVDPAAQALVRASQDVAVSGSSAQGFEANLSRHGLQPCDMGQQIKPTPVEGGSPGEYEFTWPVQDDFVLRKGSTRLFLALRRKLDPTDRVSLTSHPVPESPLLELELFVSSASASLQVLQYERFWDAGAQTTYLDHRQVQITDGSVPPPIPETPARLQVCVAHAAVKFDWPVGGYRIWLRDAPAREAPVPFTMVAIVQALPPLVKAYAPVEFGRQWELLDPGTTPSAVVLGDHEEPSLPAEEYLRQGDLAPLKPNPAAADAGLRGATSDVAGAVSVLSFLGLAKEGGSCAEFVLHPQLRRRLQQSSQPEEALKKGNWVLFKDQNNQYLGRAFRFIASDAENLRRFYVLRELPNAQDSVGIDDFGTMCWNWHGLTDTWRHELDWLVEPLNRYAPLQAALWPGSATPTDRYGINSDAMFQRDVGWQLNRQVATDRVHHVIVQRRMSFAHASIGMVQRIQPFADPDSRGEPDAFSWELVLPHEFHRATHNSQARTALGVLRVNIQNVTRTSLVADKYGLVQSADAAGNPGALLKGWLEPPQVAPGLLAPPMSEMGSPKATQGILWVDEPPCFKLDVDLIPSADSCFGVRTGVSGAEREVKAFSNGVRMKEKKRPVVFSRETGELLFPVARWDWSYSGQAQVVLEDLVLAVPDWLKGRPGLRLPDPFAMAVVMRTLEDQTVVRCGAFAGEGLFAASDLGARPAFASDWWRGEADDVPWGAVYFDPNVFASAGFKFGSDRRGDLTFQVKKEIAEAENFQLYVAWTRNGQSAPLLKAE